MAGVESRACDGPAGSLLTIIMDFCRRADAQASGWHVEADLQSSPWWIMVHNKRARSRDQGWKLHISAGVASAETVLSRALPVLLAEDAEFKVVASIQQLMKLNNGDGGFSQIGKFITVYPNDDAQAVRLALALDRATHGLRGPAIPSDRPLASGSLVHYRYGAFIHRYIQQTPTGTTLPAIMTPDGELVPDRRWTTYYAPEWAADPFQAAGVAAELPTPSPLIGGRYLIMATVYQSIGGAVAQAVDIMTPRCCVVKRAKRDAQMRQDGRDARDNLRHEADVLALLAPDLHFPAIFDLLEQDGDLFLVMEEVQGETLKHHVAGLSKQGRYVPGEQIVAWGRELAAMLTTIHSKGIIYNDLKSTNVMVTPEGRLRMIDFDLAYIPQSQVLPYGYSTRGYRSPQQDVGELPTASDDIYGLGALLYFSATGAEPALAPRPFDLIDRPLRVLNPAIGPVLEQVIARCLAHDPAERFSAMAALDAALAAVDTEVAAAPAPSDSEHVNEIGANVQ